MNPMAAPENTPKPNFATRPKCNFDQRRPNQSIDKKNSFRLHVGQNRGGEEG